MLQPLKVGMSLLGCIMTVEAAGLRGCGCWCEKINLVAWPKYIQIVNVLWIGGYFDLSGGLSWYMIVFLPINGGCSKRGGVSLKRLSLHTQLTQGISWVVSYLSYMYSTVIYICIPRSFHFLILRAAVAIQREIRQLYSGPYQCDYFDHSTRHCFVYVFSSLCRLS